MHGRLLILISLVLLLNLSPGATQLARADEGACLAWDISGEWSYSASAGGYGIFIFQQDPTNGSLTGSWQNYANGGSGVIDSGGVIGLAVGFHPTPTSTWRGTVSADGTAIRGTYSKPDASGTWEMAGQAQCTARQPLPPSGSARVTVWWGDYVYRLALEPATGRAARTPQQVTQVQRIVGPFGVRLIIEAIYYGDNLPNSVRVINRWDGQVDQLGWLYQGENPGDSGIRYRGTVTIPQRVIGPGEVIVNQVLIESPWGTEDLVSYVDQFIVDPSGYIYDADTSERIQGAMASCFVKQGSNWVLWNAEAWKQTNPLVSNEVGYYGWDVPPGDYKVVVSHECYQDAESPVVTVPPPRTDVHFALQKVGCSALDVTDIWTADGGAIPKTEFGTGEEIQTHVVISNTSTSDITVDLVWEVTDPDGQRVDALSGSGAYVVASFGAGISIEQTLPSSLAQGGYRLGVHLTHQQQTSGKTTQFWVQAREQRPVFLPLILRNYQASTEPPGIHGRVTYNGAAASNVELRLRFYNGAAWSTAATTRTDGNGRYLFTGIASLGSGQKYYVLYGSNSTDPQRLYRWFGPDITAYTEGMLVAGGDFDIANVDLVSPAPGATVTLPAIFRWRQRGLAGDTYRFGLFDPNGSDAWGTDPLGNVDSFMLSGLPSGAVYGKQYGWQVWVCNGPDSCGLSFYYRSVTFSPSQKPMIQPDLHRWPAARDQVELGRERQDK
jgi:hypothetical protein